MSTNQYLSLLTITLLLIAIGSGFYAYEKIYSITERLETPICHGASLNSGITVDNSGGEIRGTINLSNDSGVACSLTGYPKLRLEDANQQVSPVRYVRDTTDPVKRISLQPDQSTHISFDWTNWCTPDANKPTTFVLVLPGNADKVSVPAQTGANQPLAEMPQCTNQQVSSSISAGPFLQEAEQEN